MKKISVIILAALLLSACSEEKADKDQGTEKEVAPIESVYEKETISSQQDEANQEKKPVAEKNDTVHQNEAESKPAEHSVQPAAKTLSNEKFKEAIDYSMLSEGDELLSSSVADSKLYATVKLGEEAFEPSMMAASSYSALSDELLSKEGWEVLTVEFVDIGTVSMNRNEKETNELGMDYFPVAKIEANLN
ncbi:hypothetical protein SporoP37_15790 [Sporosarcina sp. P37]|uniref:membrane lipoprotein lipid attachment site-containing protein n=1 Tax=unclassified Sporosarcina TaxID=2647733 RepID=UPI000A17D93E|nr:MULTISPECIES: membrane lipoprotein lipid attachment site-containing protein [unclassified Sporosarcina]ARK25988.1 hypothetical protein SporoP37_15790 [Sporosarcina sp. P37]PID19357.1 hypothetical protein CSV62_02310 [Sporosarcina sp. P35]